MEDILLSICISSYNRSKNCAKLVQNILAIEDTRYNIFICDDCSDHENFEELWSLQNTKVTVIRNVKNVGACENWYRTIDCGNGQYILHVLDRDDICVNCITHLLNILENSLIAGGYVGMSAMDLTHSMSGSADYEILKKGGEAFVAMAGVPVHPSGFLVNRAYWSKGNYKKFFANQKKYGIYPHSYVLGELAIKDNMLYMPIAFWKSNYHGCNRYSRFYEKSDRKDFWWLPESVMKAANCLMLYLYPLAGAEYKESFLCNRLRESIYRSTIGYRNTVANKSEMGRYGVEVYYVSKSRMVLILLKYIIIFSHILKKLDREKICRRHSFILIWKQGFRDIFELVQK